MCITIDNYKAECLGIAKRYIHCVDHDQHSSTLNEAVDHFLTDDNVALHQKVIEFSDYSDEYLKCFIDEDIIERVKENGFLAEFHTQAFHAMRGDIDAYTEQLSDAKGPVYNNRADWALDMAKNDGFDFPQEVYNIWNDPKHNIDNTTWQNDVCPSIGFFEFEYPRLFCDWEDVEKRESENSDRYHISFDEDNHFTTDCINDAIVVFINAAKIKAK